MEGYWMNILTIFGNSLAELAKIEVVHAVGLLRLCIKDAGKDPNGPLAYAEYKSVFENQLTKRLSALKVTDPAEVVRKLLVVLNDKQSLLTMTVK
jgi:hypothetical protein